MWQNSTDVAFDIIRKMYNVSMLIAIWDKEFNDI